VNDLYASIVTAGTHKASSIKVAEAAKVIENTQRDINIALINELSLIFHRLGIDTEEVLKAAGTKWNFLPFRPGLVGGHCIGVDPYYLTYKAEETGYRPEIILAGRRLNDSMAEYVASRMIKLMIKRNIQPSGARVLCLGLTFKENCPDVRNTKVADVVKELQSFGCNVDVYDPWVDPQEAHHEYGIAMVAKPKPGAYDAIVIAVAHKEFLALGAKGIRQLGSPNVVIFDIKHVLPKNESDGRL
jgi:UDP-N-acetyl-D-galactosamine dehydrogenase